MTPILILSGGLIVLITVVEGLNFRRTRRITFLTAVHALIAVGYCLPPFLIALLPDTSWATGPRGAVDPNPWGIRLYLLDLADHLGLPEGAYITTGIILIGAYGALLAGYSATRALPVRAFSSEGIPTGLLAFSGAALGAIALVAMTVYTSQYTGIRELIDMGIHVRTGNFPAKWGYLQVLSQVAFPAFLILIGAAIRMPGRMRLVVLLLAAAVWYAGFLRVIHVGGRLELCAFLITPLLAAVFLMRSKTAAILIMLCVAVVGVFIANLPHTFSRDPFGIGAAMIHQMGTDLINHILFIIADFGFPHIAAAHTLTVVPDPIAFRHFIDVPLGLAYMLPNFSGVETLPPMILSLHVKLLPWIPVDLFSFGYYSLGTLGVLITFAAFGALLALFDGWLTESTGWLGQALRAAWLFYLPFRLLYADPYAVLQSGFGLITGTTLVATLVLWTAWRRRGV
ncbi:hypothetical protein RJ527_07710 [Thalassospiraceae bacterium LMO-SO8]|nr:hypothetical protein [Alphaproteobacteria bacterium LMO-S08]WND77617.1 hypothetical protein RJ527_07710 [Thalassospiraceae bacterium LMO-SO8]